MLKKIKHFFAIGERNIPWWWDTPKGVRWKLIWDLTLIVMMLLGIATHALADELSLFDVLLGFVIGLTVSMISYAGMLRSYRTMIDRYSNLVGESQNLYDAHMRGHHDAEIWPSKDIHLA